MRHIKKFNEARYNNGPKITDDHIKKLSDAKDKWRKFEDDQPWEFDYFWSKIEAYYNDWNNRYNNLDNTDVEYEMCLENHSQTDAIYNMSDKSGGYPIPGAVSDVEWRRRTGYIEAYIRTGGYSGGSCWDDDDNYARPFETDYSLEIDDLLKYIKHMLTSVIGANHPFTSIDELIEKLGKSGLIQEDDWSNMEYYGNSDDYRSYFITLWDLYVFLNKEQVL